MAKRDPLYPHTPKRKGPLFPHMPKTVSPLPMSDVAAWWDDDLLSVERHHVLLGIGESQSYYKTEFRKLPEAIQRKVEAHHDKLTKGEYYYMGGWNPWDYAIYTDFGLRSLDIVQVLPWPGEQPGKFQGEFGVVHDRLGGSVRAIVVDTTLTNWDIPGDIPPWRDVGSESYYNYTNLYRNIYDLARQQAGFTYPWVHQRIMRDLKSHPGWEVLKRYGLVKEEEEAKRAEKERRTLWERAQNLLQHGVRQKASYDEVNHIMSYLSSEVSQDIKNQMRQDLAIYPLFDAIAMWVQPVESALASHESRVANVAEAILERYEYQYQLSTIK